MERMVGMEQGDRIIASGVDGSWHIILYSDRDAIKPMKYHPVGSISAIAVCAVISGVDGCLGIYGWAEDRSYRARNLMET